MKFPAVYLLLLIPFACSIETDCYNKERFIDSYTDFMNDVRIHHEKFDHTDWQKIDEEFDKYTHQCYEKFKPEMTMEEKFEFWKNTVSYVVYKAGSDEDVEIEMDNLKIRLSNDLEEFSSKSKEELKMVINEELEPLIEDVLEDVSRGLDAVNDEIKKWLKDK